MEAQSRQKTELLIHVPSREPRIAFIIHRDDEEERTIRMLPGSIILKLVDFKNNIIDIEFAKPKKNKEIWLKSMRIRKIRTSIHKTFTDVEKEHYLNYLNEIQNYITENPGKCEEDAFEKVKMKKFGYDKALYQTIRDIRNAILKFCDPENESVKTIPDDERFIGKRPFKVHEKIHIKSQGDYTASKYSKKRGWNSLIFETVPGNVPLQIQKFNEWFPAINLVTLKFIYVKFLDTDGNAFGNMLHQMQCLIELQISANIEKLPEIIFQKMPVSLEILDLSDNNLTEISQEIARLKNLKCFYLDNNVLIEKIPIEYLSEGLFDLSLRNTAISIIPEEIQRLCSLEFLKLGNTKLEHFSWRSVNKNLLWLEIGFVKNFDEIQNYDFTKMEELSISNNDLEKKLKTRYFPKNLTSLELKNNSIQSLCGYFDLPRLNQVDLSNNKLKNFPWWFLLHPMEKVNFSNNEIEVLCSPAYWLRIKYLNLSNNKISAIELSDNEDDDENIVVQGSPGVHLNLSGNNLTFLPLKFEKIIQIVSLNLSKNKFEYETAEECLYQRLPLVLKKLNISDMPLFTLSCTLCYRMLEELTASNCQLRYICPKIFHQFVETESESFDVQRNLKLDISNNSDLEGLPFVPETIIPYPKKHDKISKSLIFWRRKEATKNTLRILTSPSLQNTQRLAFKMEFNSLKDAKNDKYYCKCCAKCGNPTKKHVIQQIMTMDLELFEKTENKSILNYWAPETWKANIITKLCDSCENDCKNAAKETLISRKRKQQKEKKNAKKQHVVTIVPQQNITDVEMKESSQYYPDSGGCSSQTAPISIQAATSSQTMPPYSYTNINEPMDCDYPSTQSSQNMQQMRFPINFDPNYMVPPQQTLYTSFISLPSQEYVYGYNSELQQHNEIQNMDTIIPQNNDTYHQQHLDTNPPIIMPRYEYYDPTVDNDYFIKL